MATENSTPLKPWEIRPDPNAIPDTPKYRLAQQLMAQIPPGWKPVLGRRDDLDNLAHICDKLIIEGERIRAQNPGVGHTVVPKLENIFAFLRYLPGPGYVRVVFIGQDPYPGIDRDSQPIATGEAFSVRRFLDGPTYNITAQVEFYLANGGQLDGSGIPLNDLGYNKIFRAPDGAFAGVARGAAIATPQSLANIYKEIKNTNPMFVIPRHGDLSNLAKQGTMWINASLTTRPGERNAHDELWSPIVRAILTSIQAATFNKCTFVAWGKPANTAAVAALGANASILTCGHPSNMSQNNTNRKGPGFAGCGHFSIINQSLISRGMRPIVWDPDYIPPPLEPVPQGPANQPVASIVAFSTGGPNTFGPPQFQHTATLDPQFGKPQLTPSGQQWSSPWENGGTATPAGTWGSGSPAFQQVGEWSIMSTSAWGTASQDAAWGTASQDGAWGTASTDANSVTWGTTSAEAAAPPQETVSWGSGSSSVDGCNNDSISNSKPASGW